MQSAIANTEPGSPGRGRPRTVRVGRILLIALAVVLTAVVVAPLAWMLSTSFKSEAEALSIPPHWWPRAPTLEAYRTLLTNAQSPVLRWFANSLLAATLHAALTVALAAPAAWALARYDFPFKRAIFGVVIATLFVPSFIFLIPNYLIVDSFGWLDSLVALIVPGAAGAFGVFFLRQTFIGLPRELEEAAIVDGANRWRVFARVALPLVRPSLATLTIISFLTNWNDFLWPVYVLFNPGRLTLPAGLSTLQSSDSTNYPLLMAGAVLASVPIIILFIVAQRHIIESVARSGVKG